MKKTAVGLFLFIFLAVSLLSSCQPAPEMMPGIDIPLDQMNIEMKLQDYPGHPNSFKNNRILDFIIRNLSDTRIVVPDAASIKIFARQGESWQVVRNDMGYVGGGGLDIDPEGWISQVILPVIVPISGPVDIRIVVVGMLEDTKKPVGAYIDFVLQP